MSYELFYEGLIQGLLLAIVAFGIMIPFRLLRYNDLSAEAAYPLGGVIFAVLLKANISPLLAIVAALLGGGIASLSAAIISLRLKVDSLLAGIIVSTMAYTLNLRLMGKPNISLMDIDSLQVTIPLVGLILFILVGITYLFLQTYYGLRFRAVGQNQVLSQRYALPVTRYKVLGLFCAGAIFALAASLMVLRQEYMDVGLGVGMAIHALAALMIGEAIIPSKNLLFQILSPLLGAIIYQQIQGVTLCLGLAPTDLKFLTGAILLIILRCKREIS